MEKIELSTAMSSSKRKTRPTSSNASQMTRRGGRMSSLRRSRSDLAGGEGDGIDNKKNNRTAMMMAMMSRQKQASQTGQQHDIPNYDNLYRRFLTTFEFKRAQQKRNTTVKPFTFRTDSRSSRRAAAVAAVNDEKKKQTDMARSMSLMNLSELIRNLVEWKNFLSA